MPQKIFVVTHDAGPSNVLSAWLETQDSSLVVAFVDGPASEILAKGVPEIERHSIQELEAHLRDAPPQLVIASCSWQTRSDKETWRLCSRLRIPSVGVFEGFSTYRDFDQEQDWPDRFWVYHEDIQKLFIQKGVPADRIEVQENLYLKKIVEKIHAYELQLPPHKKHLLYACTNLGEFSLTLSNKQAFGCNEIEALEYFYQQLEKGRFGQVTRIRIRPHPSDPPHKYEQFLSRTPKAETLISSSRVPLEEDLAKASLVVGTESMVLVIASLANKKTYSCLPPNERRHPFYPKLNIEFV